MWTALELALTDQRAFVSQAIVCARQAVEVGAGSGHLARRLPAGGCSVTALDLSPPPPHRR
jgi:2-polyprenyl-3-methyl-5-hydroxy-6-metoxy-1,4-benzoquinol methylase